MPGRSRGLGACLLYSFLFLPLNFNLRRLTEGEQEEDEGGSRRQEERREELGEVRRGLLAMEVRGAGNMTNGVQHDDDGGSRWRMRRES